MKPVASGLPEALRTEDDDEEEDEDAGLIPRQA
jgi:hypothetical protein